MFPAHLICGNLLQQHRKLIHSQANSILKVLARHVGFTEGFKGDEKGIHIEHDILIAGDEPGSALELYSPGILPSSCRHTILTPQSVRGTLPIATLRQTKGAVSRWGLTIRRHYVFFPMSGPSWDLRVRQTQSPLRGTH